MAGIWLLTLGVRQWLEYRDVKDVVDSFVVAVMQGDQARARLLLQPGLRDKADEQSASGEASIWKVSPGFSYRIQQLDVADDSAIALARIQQQYFVLKARMRLHRDRSGQWKIGHVEFHREDAIEAKRLAQAKADNERTAQGIADTLGVPVEKDTERTSAP